MQEQIKNELEKYQYFLQENGINDVSRLHGKNLRRAFKLISKYKKQRQQQAECELDQQLLQKIRKFL
ncbi:hypothetical protein M8868_06475 [Pasteurella multocida]|uniref:hypothetical protein n=1 Tax=Pasteurella multocida TaxID=747 RepID=UPI0002EA918A|nr:hypothetical protein [Pasteurella multocida]APW54628.1 hypothetical protein PMCN07_0039 [Pasteurella multocida subsp. multocida str. HN07]ARA70989.1 hypothetical protein BTV67_10715 [Pasteurella multocida subsp. multocida]ARA88458.1 hypothetical protein BTV66_02010 [Pasteurella multocida subsp. septica]AUL53695.1 hypothetical protein ATO47_06015 [Pasteurella multocida]AWB55129.1 hypothetical protein pm9n_05950 [Pasteurella multocida]